MENALHRLRKNADSCRDLAASAVTPAAREVLGALAKEYDIKATALEQQQTIFPGGRPAFNWPLQ